MAETDSVNTPTDKKKYWKKWVFENVVSLGLALLLVFMVRSSVVEAFKIPSGSMIPTLLIGDHIFVNKFAYGLKIPFSDLVTDHPVYLIKRDAPRRGDIVVFMYPKEESLYYIKRVIGTPGDTLEIRNKTLIINGKVIQREAIGGPEAQKVFDSIDESKYSANNLELYREKLPEQSHPVLIDKNNLMGENFGPITVPEDSLFVMGDNRDFSNDSRFWGFVPFRNVKGKAMVIWLSLWLNLGDGQVTFRPSRTGTLLH